MRWCTINSQFAISETSNDYEYNTFRKRSLQPYDMNQS